MEEAGRSALKWQAWFYFIYLFLALFLLHHGARPGLERGTVYWLDKELGAPSKPIPTLISPSIRPFLVEKQDSGKALRLTGEA